MSLSQAAQYFADEIRNHDWSDAPFRYDRAGHDRITDTNAGSQVLTAVQTRNVKTNAMWVVAQVLRYQDPNFDVYEFAEACGLDTRTRSGRPRDGGIEAGLRFRNGRPCRPGTWDTDPI